MAAEFLNTSLHQLKIQLYNTTCKHLETANIGIECWEYCRHANECNNSTGLHLQSWQVGVSSAQVGTFGPDAATHVTEQ